MDLNHLSKNITNITRMLICRYVKQNCEKYGNINSYDKYVKKQEHRNNRDRHQISSKSYTEQ